MALTFNRVDRTFAFCDKALFCLTVRVLLGEGVSFKKQLYCTKEHPFYIKDYGFLPAYALLRGMRLHLLTNAQAIIESVICSSQVENVYNLSILDSHSFFIERFGLWVHNTCDGRESVEVMQKPAVRKKAERGIEEMHMESVYQGRHLSQLNDDARYNIVSFLITSERVSALWTSRFDYSDFRAALLLEYPRISHGERLIEMNPFYIDDQLLERLFTNSLPRSEMFITTSQLKPSAIKEKMLTLNIAAQDAVMLEGGVVLTIFDEQSLHHLGRFVRTVDPALVDQYG
ncbi:polymorphic toxin-type HINT domain-containing protein, partial [Fangia hongkongensis]